MTGRHLTLPTQRAQRGLSYVEALVATVLVAVALVPALEGLHTGLQGPVVETELTAEHYHVASRIEELQAETFAALDAEALAVANPTTPTSYSDTAGAPRRRLVYLSRYDGDNADADSDPFTGTDEGLLWLRVEIENGTHALATLRAR